MSVGGRPGLGWRVRDRKKEFIRGLVFDRQRETHPLPSLPMRPSIKAKETYYRGKSDLLEPHDATQPTASHCGT